MIKIAPHADPVSVERLKGLVEEIETSRGRQQNETKQQRDIFARAKTQGFDTKAMRKVIQRRAMKTEDRENLDLLIDTYECALASKRLAADALSSGASVREAAKVSGLSVGSVAALRSVQNTKQIEHHDPETGEIKEAALPGDDAGHRSKPSSPAEQSVEPVPSSGRVSPFIDSGEGRQSGTHSNAIPSSAPVAASGNEDARQEEGAAAAEEAFSSRQTASSPKPILAPPPLEEPPTPDKHDGSMGVIGSAPQPDDNTTERPALQEVGASETRPKGTPIADDLAFPAHLDQRKRQVHA